MSVFSVHFKLMFKKNYHLWLVGCLFALIFNLVLGLTVFHFYYQNRFFQGISIDQVELGGLTREQALREIKNNQPEFKNTQIKFVVDDLSQTLDSKIIFLGKNYQAALEHAYQYGHQGSLWHRAQTIWQLIQKPINIQTQPSWNQQQLKAALQKLKKQVDYAAVEPRVNLTTSGQKESLTVEPGKIGRQLEIENSANQIVATLNQHYQASTSNLDQIDIPAQVASVGAKLNQAEAEQFIKRAQAVVNQSLVFSSAEEKPINENQIDLPNHQKIMLQLNDQTLVDFLAWPNEYSEVRIQQKLEAWNQQYNQPPINAIFAYEPDTLQVTKFQPHEYGISLDQAYLQEQIINNLRSIEQSAQQIEQAQQNSNQDSSIAQANLPLKLKAEPPEITLGQTNDLGIQELIGFGDSYYYHSIPARIHNVKITTDKLNLTLVKPDQEFSFNQTIGEVSSDTGYQPAYIIKDGRTVLGGGGGVCQVSTTLFRALLDAGLKITRRLPHSYRVSYYELDNKPGFDATVYAGNTDLRFINDTGHHLLIAGRANSDQLYMKVELYGTNDGRTTQIKDYKKWGYRPPPPPQYIPSSEIPAGTTKQIDWAASGIKAEFTHLVKDKNGQVISEKTYYSNYQPWSAKYLKGI